MHVDLWFYSPANDPRHVFLNSLVAAVDPPYCHCELQLPCGDAFSVYAGSAVLRQARVFDERVYTCLRIPCSPEQLAEVSRVCDNMKNEGVRFHHLCLLSAVTCSVTGPLVSPTRYTCCSRMIAHAMHAAGLLPGTRVDISPSMLFRLASPISAPLLSTSSPIDFR